MTVVLRPVRGLACVAAISIVAAGASAQEPVASGEPPPAFLIVEPLPAAGPPPADEGVRGLRELEHELLQLEARGGAYDRTVQSIARREQARRRRDRARLWDDRIRIEERHESEARERAIRLLDRFVREHDDPIHTPDAMLRLAELLYEGAVVRAEEIEGEPDFAATIATLERLVDRYPSARRIDGALYLLGYCLERGGESTRALAVYQRIVCPRVEGDECRPIAADDELVAEVWLRIGEHEFDAVRGLDRAIGAYRASLAVAPEGRLADLARYKLGWALYRADRYPEAIEEFAGVVEASDRERARTGRAGSELREEALQYVAIALAWDDWDGDRESDAERPLARALDPAILPQDRAWTAEVILRLGQIQFDEDRYDDALATWREALARWPLDPRAPATVMRMARALERLGRSEEASAHRAMLLEYGDGSAWAEANRGSHPREVAAAARLAEGALIDEAIRRHRAAQRARSALGGDGDERELARVRALYDDAARLYRELLVRFPNDAQRYEIEFDLAEALFWSGSYEEAAERYAAVRDSNVDDRYRAQAARGEVEAWHREIDRRHLAMPAAPPARGEIAEVPEPVQRLAHAREVYLARIDAAHDREHLRDAYAFNQAVLLELYGYAEHARRRFQAIYEAACGSETGREAWAHLRNLAIVRGDDAEIARLAREASTRSCAVPGEVAAAPPAPATCGTPACDRDPRCLARCDLETLAFRAARQEIVAADRASEPERSRRLEQGAALLVRAVDAAPDHEQAPLALRVAAEALERAGRPDAASRLYERILDEVAPRRAADAERQRELDRVVAAAWLRRGDAASRAFDAERALASYEALVGQERFAGSDDPDVLAMREDAMGRAAELLARRGEHARAAEAYRRVAAATSDAGNARTARFHAAEMAHRARDWTGAARELRAFADGYRDDPEAAELVVIALSELADVRREQGRETDRARTLVEVVVAFRNGRVRRGTRAAEVAADAALALADVEARGLDVAIDPGRQPTLERWGRGLQARIETASRRAAQARAWYAEVLAMGSPRASVAALERQGEILERVARSILEVPIGLPADLERRLRRSPHARAELEDRIRQMLAERVAPVECAAIGMHAQAARLARAASLDDASARAAIDRLQAYGEERIAECIEQQRASDPSLEPYRPGEFARARSAPTRPLPDDVSPPPMER